MKIIRFYAENFKRLRCVEVTPDGSYVSITGKNAHGKTSVLDGIWAVLEWRAASKEIKNPIHNDAEKGFIELDLGDYIARRTFTDGDEKVTTKLTITKPNGDIVRSPQAILDGLIGSMSFDPMEFSRMKDPQKRQAIADLVGLDLAQFDSERKVAGEERKDTKKEVSRLKALLASMTPPTAEEPTEEIPVSKLLDELNRAKDYMANIMRIETRADEIEEQVRTLRNETAELNRERHILEKVGCDARNIVEVQEGIDSLETRNARAREIQRYFLNRDAVTEREEEVRTLTARIELAKIQKDEAVEQADLPIPGLTIEPDGIMINGIDFGSLSQAEKIRYSMAMAMASNPELKVIRISDGSLLDAENIAIIEEMAKDKDFQVWVEVVADKPGDSGVYLEDGRVKTA